MRKLLLLSINGARYGVWEDEIISVRELTDIHRIPLIPLCVAGMTVIDDRTVTIADLASCLGLPPAEHRGSSRLLMVSDVEKTAGFAVESEIDRIEVSPAGVLPLPEYLKSPALDSCVLAGDQLVPVIRIAALFKKFLQADREPPMPKFSVSDPTAADFAAPASVRIISLGRDQVAVPADGFQPTTLAPPRVSALPLTPSYIKGIVHHGGMVLPLIDLAGRMRLSEPGSEKIMLVADWPEAPFAFLIDRDGGILAGNDFTVAPLPPLAHSSWLKSAVIVSNRIMPLIDLHTLLSLRPGHEDEIPLPDRYHPDPQILARFGKEELAVGEFSLLGSRQALPKAEVKEAVPLTPFYPVPNVLPIVIGVAEHQGELLPVLDLAMVFGRRSLTTPEWKMLLVQNGDFRALVITEAYYGERRLASEQQRHLPIMVANSGLYGCYPEDDTVRLIFNVENLAVYFDLAMVGSFLGALSKEMGEASAEIVPDLLPETHSFESDQEAWAAAEREVKIRAGEEARASAEREAKIRAGEEARASAEREVKISAEEEARASAEREAKIRAEEEARAAAEREAKIRAEEEARASAEREAKIRAGEEARVAADKAVFPARDDEAIAKMWRRRKVPTAFQPLRPTTYARALNSFYRDRSKRALLLVATALALILLLFTIFKLTFSPTSDVGISMVKTPQVRAPQTRATTPEFPVTHLLPEESPGMIVPTDPAVAMPMEEVATTADQSPAVTTPSISSDDAPESAEIPVPEPGPDPATITPPPPVEPVVEPLVLTVPRDAAVDIDIYIVQKGDTLWGLSWRFTGDAFNYPRIAEDSEIANPDLIFPGQRIKIIRDGP